MTNGCISVRSRKLQWRDSAYLIPLFVYALFLRLPWLDGGVIGDEAWHMHLARTLGRGPQGSDSPLAFFISRPLLPLLYSAPANMGLTVFRLTNILVCSLIPVLAAVAGRRLGLSRVLAVVGGILLCRHPVLIEYSGRVYHDGLGCVIVLSALVSYTYRRHVRTALLLAAAMLVKEFFAVAAIAFGLLSLRYERRPPFFRPTRFTAYMAASPAPLLLCAAVAYGSMGIPPPGWATGSLTGEMLGYLYITGATLPIFLALPFFAPKEATLLAFAYPLFFAVYCLVVGHGVAAWYSVAPAPLLLLGLLLGCQGLGDALRSWIGRRGSRLPVAVGLSLAGILMTYWLSGNGPGGLPSLARIAGRDQIARVVTIRPPIADPTLDQPIELVQALDRDRVLLVDSFWAYAYYPFGTRDAVARKIFTDGTDERRVVEAIAASKIVIFRLNEHNQALRRRIGACRIHSNEAYEVFEEPARCL
jgi:hypothetical protein